MDGLKIGLGQASEFFRRFGRFGGTEIVLRKLLGNDELMQRFMRAGLALPEHNLVHDVYNRTDDILQAFRSRCREVWLLDPEKFTWVTSEQPPGYTDDPEVAVVLDITHGTLRETFDQAWYWASDGHQKYRLGWEKRVQSHEDMLKPLNPAAFRPWTIGWRRIKLDVHRAQEPRLVRSLNASPGCALLWAAAQHPERMRAIDDKTRFGFWLPGLRCNRDTSRSWGSVPYVMFDVDRQLLDIFERADSDICWNLTVPSYID